MRIFYVVFFLILSVNMSSQTSNHPNVLLIFCDDLNISGLGSLIDPNIITPTIDSLVNQSAVFTNAHANSTLCGPSRASVFTGVLPSTSGHYGRNMSIEKWYENPYLSTASTIFSHLKNNNYKVYGAGKIFHKKRNKEEDFDDLYLEPFQGPYPYNNLTHSDLPEELSPINISFSPLENVPSYPEGEGWFANGLPYFYESEENRDPTGDELSLLYADSIFQAHTTNLSEDPFFLTLGLYKPHLPFHVPQKYFDMYPLEGIELSEYELDSTDFAVAAFINRINARSNQQIETLIELSPEDDP
ncbi:MAG TPA: sulfatase-like hydrolase/transferase, partial [Cryomorphaceae bacterium]|nr:sulfatase-like hydrolase/transferase [Cryomorphaceae bacterium]